MLALSLTLMAGTAGQISFGHAGLLAIGAYASALLTVDLDAPTYLTIPAAGLITSALGTLLIFPAFRLRGHTIAIATLAIGEVVSLVILNWESLTRGAMGVTGIPPLSIFGHEIYCRARSLLALPRHRRRAGAGADAAAELAFRPHVARHSRRRRRRALLRDSPRPLQGAGLRVRRLRRRRQRRHHRPSLFLHQPPDLRLRRSRCWR